MREGFENTLIDMRNAFVYLKDFGFICSAETTANNYVNIGYVSAVYNILF